MKKERVFSFGVLPSKYSGSAASLMRCSDGAAGGGWGKECRAVLALASFKKKRPHRFLREAVASAWKRFDCG